MNPKKKKILAANFVTTLGGLDPNAAAYLALLTNPDATLSAAINTLFVNIKSAGLWTNMLVLQPFPTTATAADCAINARLPGVFDITWVDTTAGMFTTSGFKGAGVGYGATGLIPDTALPNPSENASGVYIVSGDAIEASFEYGVRLASSNFLNLAVRFNAGSDSFYSHQNQFIQVTNSTNITGLHAMTRRSLTDLEAYKRGASVGTQTTAADGVLPDKQIYLNARNGGGGGETPENIGSRTIGFYFVSQEAYSDTQMSTINSIIEAYQTALGRAAT